jgi:hypothetical protein
MVPNPTQLAKPETEGEEKVESKPTTNTESENKQLEQIMATSFKLSAQECEWKTEELAPAMVTEHLNLHHEDNHGIRGASLDKLQKLDRPGLMTGCS